MKCSVFDWLVVLVNPEQRSVDVIVNDKDSLHKYYDANKRDIWVGYNSNYYDQYILKGILCGFDPKRVNDFIIEKGKFGWQFSSMFKEIPLISYDCMIGNHSLKQLEGFLGNKIKESSVPFDIDRKLTDEEIAETIEYCKHDVFNTMQVFEETIAQFKTKLFFIKHYNYPLTYLSKTMAQLSCTILGGNGKYLRENYNDEFDYPVLDCLDINKYKDVVEWFKNKTHYGENYVCMVAGIPHTFGAGGIHGNDGVIKNGENDAIPVYLSGIFVMIDVTAYYPSMQEENHWGYRVMDNPQEFEFIHGSNIEFKRKGDKEARQPFKIMDNAISGQLKQKTSKLYDPMSNNAITANGQLMLLDLIEHIEGFCQIVQSNTDGILVKLDRMDDFDLLDDAVYEWECRTGMKMDFDTYIGHIYQKDCNNYLLIDYESGKIKRKGCIKKLSVLDNNLPIINKACVDYLAYDIPMEQTINECNELKQFQMICRISKLYKCLIHGDDVLNERCVRVFASKNKRDGGLYQLHRNKTKPDKYPSTPIHCFIDNEDVNGVPVPNNLDREWYIDMAKKIVKGFGKDV